MRDRAAAASRSPPSRHPRRSRCGRCSASSRATVPAGNVIDPERTIPRATLWGTLIAAVIYVAGVLDRHAADPRRAAREVERAVRRRVRLFWGDRAASCSRCSRSSAASARSTAGFSCRARCRACWRAKECFRRSSRANRATERPARRCSSPARSATRAGADELQRVDGEHFHVHHSRVHVRVPGDVSVLLARSAQARAGAAIWVQGRQLGALLVVAMLAALYSLWTLYGAGAEAFWWSIALFAAGVPVYFAMKWQRRREATAATIAASQQPRADESFESFDHATRFPLRHSVRARAHRAGHREEPLLPGARIATAWATRCPKRTRRCAR